MSTSKSTAESAEPELDLRDRFLAGVLAWLWPGAGHFYQRRTGKAILLMTCIMGTFVFGLVLGQGRVVYASMRADDKRLPYLLQVGVGIPALPALVQAARKEPWGTFMAPPAERLPDGTKEIDKLHRDLNRSWELGTMYTMVAGLLNLLAIYDACCGPAYGLRRKEEESPPEPTASPASPKST